MLARRNRTILSNEDLIRRAPSIFAEHPHESRSERYAFIPTIAMIDTLRGQGWNPVQAMEQRVNSQDKKGYQKHVVRFQHANMPEQYGVLPELLLTNSHDGLSCFRFAAGLYRLVCSNGLIAFDPAFGNIHVRHSGYNDQEAIRASNAIIEVIPKVVETVQTMQAVELAEQERLALATSAALEKWQAPIETLPFPVSTLLTPRRNVDQAPDLWTTMNVIQENLIRGGIRYRKIERDENTGRAQIKRNTTRAVTGINEDIRINKAVWLLAENMRRIKQGEPLLNDVK